MKTLEKENYAKEQSQAQLSAIVEAVENLDMAGAVRNEVNKLTRDALIAALRDAGEYSADVAPYHPTEDLQELLTLSMVEGEAESIIGDWNEDSADDQLREMPLSIEFRSGWQDVLPLEVSEFCILLSTGGPACRIVGGINSDGEPFHARLEYQDWGTPWTQLFSMSDHERDCLAIFCARLVFIG